MSNEQFIIEDNTLKDSRGRILMSLKGKGWVLSRYPDMTPVEKEYLLDIFTLIEGLENGSVNDFMGNKLTREAMEAYLDFKEEPKGDLCG